MDRTTLDLAKSYINKKNYKILDVTESTIMFRYKLNEMFFTSSETDPNFFTLNLTVDPLDNAEQDLIMDRCYNITKDMKMVKMYWLKDAIMVSAELFYLDKKDFEFQFHNALDYVLNAKRLYRVSYEG